MHHSTSFVFDTSRISPRASRSAEAKVFAATHALHIFHVDAIYTFIPKNACSTMRYSLALHNGYIQGEKEFDWIHANNLTLAVRDKKVMFSPSYSFVILRCPFTRLLSVFFDKFISEKPSAKKFIREFMPDKQLGDLSFQDFIFRICELESHQLNRHWRPQIDFLLYHTYDRYFCLENMRHAIETLEKDIGFEVHDTRHLSGHETSSRLGKIQIDQPWKLPISSLKQHTNALPGSKSMYSKELIALVSQYYREDVEIYSDKFGLEDLLFS